jgi:predicted nucleotidyltransferase component of viral defense system
MNPDIKNIAASVRGRLQNKAKETGRAFSEILQCYGMERFLFRLSQSKYADAFILKGALMFVAWQMPERRTTLDIDLLARHVNEVAKIEGAVRDICAAKVPADGLVFKPDSVKGRITKEDAEYEGVRIKLMGYLERSRIPMQIDFGFGDIIYPSAQKIKYPALLDFPAPKLKGYTPESVVSEKFEAMVKLGDLNSRMKDFYDIWNMMRQFDFEGGALVKAIEKTFGHRKTTLPASAPFFSSDIYAKNSMNNTRWKAFLETLQIKNVPSDLGTVVQAMENFLLEPVKAVNDGSDFVAHWHAPGPWR